MYRRAKNDPRLLCNQEHFVYNAYHMVKAFYPSETVALQWTKKTSELCNFCGDLQKMVQTGREKRGDD